MDENAEALTTTDAEIDAAWNDEEAEVVDDGEQAAEQPEADQPKEQEQPAETPAENAEKPKEEPKPDATDVKPPEANQPLTFTLKHLDETRTVDQNEVVKLAQQGMDYERIRTERDQLKEYRKEADPALNLLKSYADKVNMTVPAYIDFVRKQELIASGINEQTANAQIAVEKQQAALKSEQEAKAQIEAQAKAQEADKKAREAAEQQQIEKRKSDMARFLQKHPDIDPKTIPAEVWAEVAKGDSLASAYTDYRNKQLEAENAALKQNQQNAQKTTGSLTTKGAGVQNEIDKWWNEDG